MDQAGLWRLFFRTGLPEVYLALRRAKPRPRALAAFRISRCREEGA